MKKKNKTKEMPTGIRIISVLLYAVAGLLVLGIPGIFIIGAFFGIGKSIIMMILDLLVAGASFLFARGISRAKNWARIGAIVLAFFGILLFGATIVLGIINNGWGMLLLMGLDIAIVVICGVIIGYLLFNEKVKKYFSN